MIFLDIETTGLDLQQSKIIQFGAVNGDEEINLMFNPQMKVDQKVLDLTGIAQAELDASPLFKDSIDFIYDLMKDQTLCGHNLVSFDLPIILNQFEKFGKDTSELEFEVVDTIKMYRNMYSARLENALMMVCGKEAISGLNFHDALDDVLATKQLYEGLCKNIGLDTEEDAIAYSGGDAFDLQGKFKLINERVCFNFGKYKNHPLDDVVRNDKGYMNWVMRLPDLFPKTKKWLAAMYGKKR